MIGPQVGQKPLREIEGILKEKNYTLIFRTPDGRISIEITYWDKLVPPIIVTVGCHGQERYGHLHWTLAEVCEKEPFDLTRFVFVDPQGY